MNNLNVTNMEDSCMKNDSYDILWNNATRIYGSGSTMMRFDFAVFGVLMTVISLLGIAGNTTIILVLRKGTELATVSPYLICLAVCDNIVIVVSHGFVTLIFGLKSFINMRYICSTFNAYMNMYAFHVFSSGVACCGFLSVAMSITRFISISKPIFARRYFTPRLHWRVAGMIILAVLILANMNICFLKISTCFDSSGHFQYSLIGPRNNSIPIIKFVYDIALLLAGSTCFLSVCISNALLLWKLRETAKTRQKIATHMQETRSSMRMTATLIAISVSFVVLLFPYSIMDILGTMGLFPYSPTLCNSPLDMRNMRIVYALGILPTVNSSINIIWHLILGTGFRSQFVRLFDGICNRNRNG